MYEPLLVIHSLMRWVVLLLAAFVVARAWIGWLGRRPETALGRRTRLALVISVDLQLLVGLALYLVSPITQAAFGAMGEAMKDSFLRYWAVEHLTIMVVAVVLVHLGHALAKRAPDDASLHKRVALLLTAAVIAFIVGIPWPGMEVGRPLLPGT